MTDFDCKYLGWKNEEGVGDKENRAHIHDCHCFHCTEAVRAKMLRGKPSDPKILERWKLIGGKEQ